MQSIFVKQRKPAGAALSVTLISPLPRRLRDLDRDHAPALRSSITLSDGGGRTNCAHRVITGRRNSSRSAPVIGQRRVAPDRMGEAPLGGRIFDPLDFGRPIAEGRAHAVWREFARPEPPHRHFEGHVGKGLPGTLAGKDERVVASPRRPHLGEDRQHRGAERHAVRLGGLHPVRGNGPDGRRLVDLVPSRPEGSTTPSQPDEPDRMVRIAITTEAFEAIARTLPLGSVGYEAEATERGERLIWLKAAMVNLLFPPSATVLCSARRG